MNVKILKRCISCLVLWTANSSFGLTEFVEKGGIVVPSLQDPSAPDFPPLNNSLIDKSDLDNGKNQDINLLEINISAALPSPRQSESHNSKLVHTASATQGVQIEEDKNALPQYANSERPNCVDTDGESCVLPIPLSQDAYKALMSGSFEELLGSPSHWTPEVNNPPADISSSVISDIPIKEQSVNEKDVENEKDKNQNLNSKQPLKESSSQKNENLEKKESLSINSISDISNKVDIDTNKLLPLINEQENNKKLSVVSPPESTSQLEKSSDQKKNVETPPAVSSTDTKQQPTLPPTEIVSSIVPSFVESEKVVVSNEIQLNQSPDLIIPTISPSVSPSTLTVLSQINSPGDPIINNNNINNNNINNNINNNNINNNINNNKDESVSNQDPSPIISSGDQINPSPIIQPSKSSEPKMRGQKEKSTSTSAPPSVVENNNADNYNNNPSYSQPIQKSQQDQDIETVTVSTSLSAEQKVDPDSNPPMKQEVPAEKNEKIVSVSETQPDHASTKDDRKEDVHENNKNNNNNYKTTDNKVNEPQSTASEPSPTASQFVIHDVISTEDVQLEHTPSVVESVHLPQTAIDNHIGSHENNRVNNKGSVDVVQEEEMVRSLSQIETEILKDEILKKVEEQETLQIVPEDETDITVFALIQSSPLLRWTENTILGSRGHLFRTLTTAADVLSYTLATTTDGLSAVWVGIWDRVPVLLMKGSEALQMGAERSSDSLFRIKILGAFFIVFFLAPFFVQFMCRIFLPSKHDIRLDGLFVVLKKLSCLVITGLKGSNANLDILSSSLKAVDDKLEMVLRNLSISNFNNTSLPPSNTSNDINNNNNLNNNSRINKGDRFDPPSFSASKNNNSNLQIGSSIDSSVLTNILTDQINRMEIRLQHYIQTVMLAGGQVSSASSYTCNPDKLEDKDGDIVEALETSQTYQQKQIKIALNTHLRLARYESAFVLSVLENRTLMLELLNCLSSLGDKLSLSPDLTALKDKVAGTVLCNREFLKRVNSEFPISNYFDNLSDQLFEDEILGEAVQEARSQYRQATNADDGLAIIHNIPMREEDNNLNNNNLNNLNNLNNNNLNNNLDVCDEYERRIDDDHVSRDENCNYENLDCQEFCSHVTDDNLVSQLLSPEMKVSELPPPVLSRSIFPPPIHPPPPNSDRSSSLASGSYPRDSHSNRDERISTLTNAPPFPPPLFNPPPQIEQWSHTQPSAGLLPKMAVVEQQDNEWLQNSSTRNHLMYNNNDANANMPRDNLGSGHGSINFSGHGGRISGGLDAFSSGAGSVEYSNHNNNYSHNSYSQNNNMGAHKLSGSNEISSGIDDHHKFKKESLRDVLDYGNEFYNA